MAYTDKDAIYEIAEKLGYQGDEGLTTTEAVYAVAAALGYTGEHDKSVALALSDLYTVVGGGGGGGVTLGDMQTAPYVAYAVPEVGNSFASGQLDLFKLGVGDAVAIDTLTIGSGMFSVPCVAAGVTLVFPGLTAAADIIAAYACTYDGTLSKYGTVTPLNLAITREAMPDFPDGSFYSFVMPEMEADTYLVVYSPTE